MWRPYLAGKLARFINARPGLEYANQRTSSSKTYQAALPEQVAIRAWQLAGLSQTKFHGMRDAKAGRQAGEVQQLSFQPG